MKKVVICEHDGVFKKYLFLVPDDVDVECGDLLLCDTSKGADQVVTAVSPSFEVPDERFESFCASYNTKPNKMKPITGKVTKERFDKEIESDEEDVLSRFEEILHVMHLGVEAFDAFLHIVEGEKEKAAKDERICSIIHELSDDLFALNLSGLPVIAMLNLSVNREEDHCCGDDE